MEYGNDDFNSIVSGNKNSPKTKKGIKSKKMRETKAGPGPQTVVTVTTCPHADGSVAPVCWDCIEEDHARREDDFSSLEGDSIRRCGRPSQVNAESSSWGGSTLEKASILPEWHPPEPGLETRYPDGVSTPANQSVAPEWHPPEAGLEVVQPETAEKILVTRVVLGLTLRARASDSSPTSSPSSPTATTDPSATTASAGVMPTPTLTGMPPCPGANGTIYTDPTTKAKFERECGLAHDGSDLSHHIAYSMDDCVASCAQSSIWHLIVSAGEIQNITAAMESLGDEPWDVVICGTGLQQSLLALSNKRILHLDPNDYYGQHEAALSLQEAHGFAATHADITAAEDGATPRDVVFRNATVWKHPEAEANGLAYARAYSLALAPQIIHTRSKLLSQLVSSRAYRQVDFLAVGSFFVYEPAKGEAAAKVTRIPSSREDVFSNSSIPAKAKRSLMKFLKFVIDYDSDEQRDSWRPHADRPLSDFLAEQYKLDDDLRKYILALTLTLDGKITAKDGLAAISRHLTSMGVFGPGFCAVYPKWGGLSEVAQVACRAGAVGGGIYMLDTGMRIGTTSAEDKINLDLSNGISVQARTLFSAQDASTDGGAISRLTAVVNSPLKSLFEVMVEGAPTPTVAVVAFPADSTSSSASAVNLPIYAMAHSSETGECPVGQTAIYLTTLASPGSKERLEKALKLLLAQPGESETPISLYQLYYEQTVSPRTTSMEMIGSVPKFSFPSLPLGLALADTDLDAVLEAWKVAMGDDTREDEYMIFEDREGADAHDDDVYE
ncbi:rab protein geranylgeranyltransferase component A [Seiridium cupressi]